jgi:hypothetical protein
LILLSSPLSKCETETQRVTGPSELGSSVKLAFLTLALFFYGSHVLRDIDSNIPNEGVTDSMVISASRRVKRAKFSRTPTTGQWLQLLQQVGMGVGGGQGKGSAMLCVSKGCSSVFFLSFLSGVHDTYLAGDYGKPADKVLSACLSWSGSPGSEYCGFYSSFSAELVSAWNYKAGTDRCISRCSRAN